MPIVESNDKFIVECDCTDQLEYKKKINCCYRFLRRSDKNPEEFASVTDAVRASKASGWIIRGKVDYRVYCSYCTAVIGLKRNNLI